jgi:hypothetical protein
MWSYIMDIHLNKSYLYTADTCNFDLVRYGTLLVILFNVLVFFPTVWNPFKRDLDVLLRLWFTHMFNFNETLVHTHVQLQWDFGSHTCSTLNLSDYCNKYWSILWRVRFLRCQSLTLVQKVIPGCSQSIVDSYSRAHLWLISHDLSHGVCSPRDQSYQNSKWCVPDQGHTLHMKTCTLWFSIGLSNTHPYFVSNNLWITVNEAPQI